VTVLRCRRARRWYRAAILALPLALAATTGGCVGHDPEIVAAAHSGDLVRTRALIARGDPIDARDRDDFNALMWAAGGGHQAVVELLLEAAGPNPERVRAYVNLASRSGRTATRQAASGGHQTVLATLLRAGAVASDSRPCPSALAEAARKGHLGATEVLLAAGAQVNEWRPCLTGFGGPLASATGEDHPEVVRALLRAGADANQQQGPYRQTPLINAVKGPVEYDHRSAAERGSDAVAVVTALLEAGAHVDQKDMYGDTALVHAASTRRAEVVRGLEVAAERWIHAGAVQHGLLAIEVHELLE
jgi:ankyrin repeat protein